MIVALAIAGGVAEAIAWAVVSLKRVRVWGSLALVLAAAGVASLATGKVALSPLVSPLLAATVGLAAGLLLFAATRAFVAVVWRWWPPFGRHVNAIYGQEGGWPLGATLLAALAVEVGEELFWRGLVQGRLGASGGRPLGAVVAWLVYIGANLPSANLPIIAGAVVGGAVWGALTFWTGGVLACLLCHAAWTELMIAFPPAGVSRQRRTADRET